MSDLSTIFTNIADSIRDKAKITNTMLPSEMPHYIDGIETGGGKQNLKVIAGTTSKLTMFTSVYESEV
jgi:hypothetical protein